MKTLTKTTLALALTLGVINIAKADLPTELAQGSDYKFSFDAGGVVKTTNFEDDKSGVLVGATGWFTDNIGLGADVRSFDNNHRAIDETHVNGYFKINEGAKASSAFYVGGLRDWESRDWGVEAGLRGDLQLHGRLSGFGKVGWEKYLDADADHTAVGVLGLSVKF